MLEFLVPFLVYALAFAVGSFVAAAPYHSPVKGTGDELAKINADLAKSPLVNPPDEVRSRLHVFKWLEEAEDTEINRLFQDAIGA